jgi:putative MFS transporter
VVGYATMTEFVPPQARGKWLGIVSVFVVSGLPVTGLLGTLLISHFGWRIMFVLGGVGAMVVWYLRKALPESPRWLESVGRTKEADTILLDIEREVSLDHSPLREPLSAPPALHSHGLGSLLNPILLPRMIVGSITLIVVNTLIFGFVTWLPTFFVQQGRSIASSLGYSLIISLGAPLGTALGAFTADSWGRKPTIIGASLLTIVIGSIYPFVHDPAVLLSVGFLLMIPIYILVAVLFAIYIPELFPTEVRMRAAGICNTFGRGATILTPFIVVALFRTYKVVGVVGFLIALLIVQIFVVYRFGVEPKKKRLEEIEP